MRGFLQLVLLWLVGAGVFAFMRVRDWIDEGEAMNDPWRIEALERDGRRRVEVRGHDDWFEAICPECNEPIRWVLDLIGFTSRREGALVMAHARCVWTSEAFIREAAKAPPGD